MNAEAIRRSLEGCGLRCTPQRYAVMAFLMERNRHPYGCGNLRRRESNGSALIESHNL